MVETRARGTGGGGGEEEGVPFSFSLDIVLVEFLCYASFFSRFAAINKR